MAFCNFIACFSNMNFVDDSVAQRSLGAPGIIGERTLTLIRLGLPEHPHPNPPPKPQTHPWSWESLTGHWHLSGQTLFIWQAGELLEGLSDILMSLRPLWLAQGGTPTVTNSADLWECLLLADPAQPVWTSAVSSWASCWAPLPHGTFLWRA